MKSRIFMDVSKVFQISDNLYGYSDIQTNAIEKYRMISKRMVDNMEGKAEQSLDIASNHIHLETTDAIRRLQAFSNIYKFTGENRLLIDKEATALAQIEKLKHRIVVSNGGTNSISSKVVYRGMTPVYPFSLEELEEMAELFSLSVDVLIMILNEYIPNNVPNDTIVAIMDVFNCRNVRTCVIKKHLSENVEKIDKVYQSGEYIENQSLWGDVQYAYTNMKQSGCGIIAIINAFHSLGEDLTDEEVAELISEFERDGCVRSGTWGTSPLAIVKYFEKNTTYEVEYTTSTDSADIEEISDNDTFIVLVYNDRDDISEQMHYVNIEKIKDENGNEKYIVHNAGEFEDKDHDGRIEAGEYNEYDSLEEAIEAVGYDDNSRSIMIIGLTDPILTDAPENKEKTC